MSALISTRLIAIAGLFGALACEATFPRSVDAASLPVAAPGASSGGRWVTFDLAGLDSSGNIQAGKPVSLAITLGGVTRSRVPLVAVCESNHFERRTVTMEPDADPLVMKATAILEPIPPGKLSVSPRAARIQVTFARAYNEKKLIRVLTRIVYVTMEAQTPAADSDEAGPPFPGDVPSAALAPLPKSPQQQSRWPRHGQPPSAAG